MRSVFERTVEWAIEHGIETATFHILTPYPGHRAVSAAWRRRAASPLQDWDLYDTRHAVFRPARMTAGRARARLLARLPGVLSLGLDRPRRCGA